MTQALQNLVLNYVWKIVPNVDEISPENEFWEVESAFYDKRVERIHLDRSRHAFSKKYEKMMFVEFAFDTAQNGPFQVEGFRCRMKFV